MPDAPTDDISPRQLEQTAAIFGLLSAPVRLHILRLLAEHQQDVGTLATATGQSVATVSHHLGKLRLAGLVRAQRRGKYQDYVATDSRVLAVIQLALAEATPPPGDERALRVGV